VFDTAPETAYSKRLQIRCYRRSWLVDERTSLPNFIGAESSEYRADDKVRKLIRCSRWYEILSQHSAVLTKAGKETHRVIEIVSVLGSIGQRINLCNRAHCRRKTFDEGEESRAANTVLSEALLSWLII